MKIARGREDFDTILVLNFKQIQESIKIGTSNITRLLNCIIRPRDTCGNYEVEADSGKLSPPLEDV
ncbi:hypothetical protein OGM63_27855 [Plectonema radiosum NIES-515]|uniref:Uncharacterized protein n=1 Tax=Plectonema radiosum NIES-515 TaxID=2986073 RepID=A0ABT3B7G8_9CYAN|nr:hypothetical protein [Plectonema radiosum]MCV3217279.1 hypothetical protein [Plectonema radiosum NIES-515]